MKKYKWVNMYLLAQAQGFVYFKAYVDVQSNAVVGWITRIGLKQPYAYNIYYSGPNGLVSDTRGSHKHATYAIEGAIAARNARVGEDSQIRPAAYLIDKEVTFRYLLRQIKMLESSK